MPECASLEVAEDEDSDRLPEEGRRGGKPEGLLSALMDVVIQLVYAAGSPAGSAAAAAGGGGGGCA